MSNPLLTKMRQISMYVKLPSLGQYNEEGDIEFSPNNELAIYPMTARDEIALKTPDSLLNGEGIIQVIQSCCPSVKNPRSLVTNDIDVILVAISAASKGNKIQFEDTCRNEECKHVNKFDLDILPLLEEIKFLESEYSIELTKELKIFIKPYDFTTNTKLSLMAFEESKYLESIDMDNLENFKGMQSYAKVIQKLAGMTVDNMINAIVKIEVTENNVKEVVDNKDHIHEWLMNIDSNISTAIQEKIDEINKIGLDPEVDVTCEKCETTWKSNVFLNPSDFFGFGF